MGDAQTVGSLGEELVVKFLMKRGFKILNRNYRRPWGELDIVAERKGKIHFVEVKALARKVSDETTSGKKGIWGSLRENVSSETQEEKSLQYIRSKLKKDRFRPEDSVGPHKIKRLGRIIQTYLMGRHVSDETDWQFDVATVIIDEEKKVARVNLIEDVILERPL